ncbi:hypothetical protein B0G69_3301 [Paraburkholderia sp. RAU2J]|uniref:hypothetical protein n=1 Tax=Paraburkholderia sp. RAU2J TaxID=1938810 RepID=UPI000EAB8399|nr:hypothetical protein [Paraburkholderia sp. RAU2J]RKT27480.1 hypothetical protein B0G69_3301 [Paraburkholderia sp. RAU2J]
MTSKKHVASQVISQPRETPQSAQSADRRLDEALEESFPASDPIAVDLTDPHHAPGEAVSSETRKRRH